jgi:hypothetical protein
MDDLMELFERFHDTEREINHFVNIGIDKKECLDINARSVKGERFACRNYLSNYYSKLTQEQKELIGEFQALLGSALVEDRNDKEYNLKNYEMLYDNNFSIKV